MKVLEPITRRWTKREYYQAAELGWFESQRVQLIFGEIYEMPAQGHAHVKAVWKIGQIMRKLYEPQHWVREQAPLDASDISQPEPDVAVSERAMADYTDHPTALLPAIEVSDATLPLDRRKAALYAASGVQEYWIVNLRNKTVEVHREPAAEPASESGFVYLRQQVMRPGESISPVSLSSASIPIAELFD